MKPKAFALTAANVLLCAVLLIWGLLGSHVYMLISAAVLAAGGVLNILERRRIERAAEVKKKAADEMLLSMKLDDDRQKTHLKKSYISHIILNDEDYMNMAEREALTPLDGDCFLVALFYFVKDGELFFEPAQPDDNKSQRLAAYALFNVLGDLLKDAGIDGTAMRIQQSPFCLVTYNDAPGLDLDAEIKRFIAVLKKTVSVMNEKMGTTVRAYVGQPHPGLAGIRLSYEDAEHAKELCVFVGDKRSVVSSDSLPGSEFASSDSAAAISSQKQLLNCIETRDYQRAKECLGQLLDLDYYKKPPSIGVVKLRIYSLLNTVLDMFITVGYDVDGGFVDQVTDSMLKFFEQITGAMLKLNIDDYSSLRERVESIFGTLFDYATNKSEALPAWFADMLNYIEDNYRDPNLNVNAVSDVVNMSPTYISKITKKYTGNGLWDYIQQKRVKYAKELLMAGQNVMVSAQESGFSNPRSMTRAFVKFEGTTPGRFIHG